LTPVNHYNIEEEAALISECLKGNRKEQERLYRMFAPKMYAICLRYAGNEFDAKDIMQDGFIKVYGHLDSYKGSGVLEGWLKKIFVRTCIEFHKRKKYISRDDIEEVAIKDTGLSGFDKIAAQDLFVIISKLPDGYRAVVNLYLVEGYSHKEISEMIGIAEVTSRTQLARAKSHLQKQIELYSIN